MFSEIPSYKQCETHDAWNEIYAGNAMTEARKAYRVKKGILDYNIRKMLANDIVMAINFPF